MEKDKNTKGIMVRKREKIFSITFERSCVHYECKNVHRGITKYG